MPRALRDQVRNPSLRFRTYPLPVIELEWCVRVRGFATIHARLGRENQRAQSDVETVVAIRTSTGLRALRFAVLQVPIARVFTHFRREFRHPTHRRSRRER